MCIRFWRNLYTNGSKTFLREFQVPADIVKNPKKMGNVEQTVKGRHKVHNAHCNMSLTAGCHCRIVKINTKVQIFCIRLFVFLGESVTLHHRMIYKVGG